MTESLFALAAQIGSVCVGILGIITLVTWVRQSEWRFAFVGYTAFTLVLTAGCFALSLAPIIPTAVAGSVRYSTVYDRGTNLAVIAVTPDITPEQLEHTLAQATTNLATSGRYSAGSNVFTLKARTIIHPEPGISLPLYLGQAQQALGQRQDPNRKVEIFADAFRQLKPYQQPV